MESTEETRSTRKPAKWQAYPHDCDLAKGKARPALARKSHLHCACPWCSTSWHHYRSCTKHAYTKWCTERSSFISSEICQAALRHIKICTVCADKSTSLYLLSLVYSWWEECVCAVRRTLTLLKEQRSRGNWLDVYPHEAEHFQDWSSGCVVLMSWYFPFFLF